VSTAAPAALLAWIALFGTPQETPLQEAVRLTGEGRPAAALLAAGRSQEPVERARAELFVYHRAGALDDALAAGLRALAEEPSDPWTLEETAYVALSLGDGALASSLLERLRPQQAGEALERTAWMGEEAARLEGLRVAEGAALERARLVALAALAGALLLGGFAARLPRPR